MLNERLGYDHGQHDASPATLGKTTGSPYLRERYALGDEVHRGRVRACLFLFCSCQSGDPVMPSPRSILQ